MTPWDEHVAFIREAFVDGLVQRGMRLTVEESRGADSKAILVNREVTVTIRGDFPYRPPKVTTNIEVPRTWHQERDGGLCLYTSRDRDHQPWLDPEAFLKRIALWFENNKQGWPDDSPALDLEVYLGLRVDPRFIIHTGVAERTNEYVRLRGDELLLRVVGLGKAPKKSNKELTGYVVDLGPLTEPPIEWDSLVAQLEKSSNIRETLRGGRVDVLFVRYSRSGQEAVLAVTFTSGSAASEPRIARSAGYDPSAMELRAGRNAPVLRKSHVYVIGAGALGSHICDGLSRAGIGRLTIRDSEVLTPGNMTRHLVTDIALCGLPKATVVKAILAARPYNRAEITCSDKSFINAREAESIFEQCDLLVDATADGAVTSMLESAARITGNRFLTACLQNEGRTQRLDVVPPHEDAQPLPLTQLLPPSGPEIYEGGCGEPVSPTPPYAVAEAAAMTVRHIVGHLSGRPPTMSGEIRDCL